MKSPWYYSKSRGGLIPDFSPKGDILRYFYLRYLIFKLDRKIRQTELEEEVRSLRRERRSLEALLAEYK